MPNLMHNTFTFAGVSSASLGLTVEKVPNMNRPARKYDRYSVPGRNGDIFVFQDAWENIEQSYEICWKGTPVDTGYNIAEWLFGSSGYQMLTDSYDPLHYRNAVFLGPYDVENTLMRYGRATITFDCDPRRFLMSGLEWIDLPVPPSEGLEVLNPTPFPAKPVYDVTITPGNISNIRVVSESGTTTVLTINKPGHFIVDSSKESIVDENGDPAFNSTFGTFPTLYPGVSLLNPQQNGKVQPNWWTI